MTAILLTALGVYGLLLLCGCALQRKLLYFPTQLTPAAANQLAREAGFLLWQSSTGETMGWRVPASGVCTGSVLIVHGNSGCALNRSYLAQPIHAAGARDVFVLEYPGYGSRGGTPDLKSWLAAGEAAVAQLPGEQPIFVVSESIGAGVAAHLAKTFPRQIAGLVMIVPYDSLAAVAQSKMPLLLPYLFLRDRYEPARWLQAYRGPVQVVVAGRDEVIAPKFGQRLFDSYAGPKSLQIFPEATHNGVAEQPADWWREVLQFCEQHRAQPPPQKP